jgi:hypothetical protein
LAFQILDDVEGLARRFGIDTRPDPEPVPFLETFVVEEQPPAPWTAGYGDLGKRFSDEDVQSRHAPGTRFRYVAGRMELGRQKVVKGSSVRALRNRGKFRFVEPKPGAPGADVRLGKIKLRQGEPPVAGRAKHNAFDRD